MFLNNKACEVLQIYLNSREDYSPALFVVLKGSDKDRLSKNGIEQAIGRLGKKCGIKAHPHKFRRTFCTRLLENNIPIQDAAKLMGHSSSSTTQIYDATNQSLIKKRYMECLN